MPPPPSNPLTMLRKLGTTLIGRDGLLTTAASTALGYSPMDRVKNRLAAQAQVENEMKFKSGLDADALKAKSDQLALDTNTYELGRKRTVDQQTDAERAARGATVASALMPGPPNPDGSPTMDPNAALGTLAGQQAVSTARKVSGMEVMTPALFNELRQLGMDPGVQVGESFDISQLNSALTARTANEQVKARRDIANAAAASRADARIANDRFKQDGIVGRISTALQSNEAYKKYVSVRAEAQGLKQLIRNAENDPNGTSDIAIVNMFQRLADPGVAVREGDVALIQAAQGILPRVANFSAWIEAGNRLAPQTRANMLNLIDPIIEARANAARETAQPFRNRALANNIDLAEVFPEGFFPEDGGMAVPAPASQSAAPASAPQTPTQSSLDAFRNRHNIRRPQ